MLPALAKKTAKAYKKRNRFVKHEAYAGFE
jgi:hypothetical protein